MRKWDCYKYIKGLSNYLFKVVSLGAHTHKAPFLVYRQTSNISRTLEGNIFVDHSDVFGAPPVGAAPTASSFF